MNKKIFSKTLTTILIFLLVLPVVHAYGHGIGIDKTPSQGIGGKKISVTVETSMYFDDSKERLVTITANDENEKQNAKNVTFLIGIFHENKMLLRNYFFAPDGTVRINIQPSEGELKFIGKQDSLLGAWHEDGKPITIQGPLFTSGGLYNFEIEIRTIDEPKNIVENSPIFRADVSIMDTATFAEQSLDGTPVDFKIKSYYEKIENFDYNPEQKTVTFKIPFDWSEQRINHIPVIHKEVHFPKDFSEFLVPGYAGKVNGIDLFKSSVTIDDYTEENERIVHFVLLTDHIKFLKNSLTKSGSEPKQEMIFTLSTTDEVQFPLQAMTRNEDVRVDLSWEPLDIEIDKKTKFIFTFRDGKTGDTIRNAKYDFVILQQGNEIYRKSGTAAVGGAFEEYTFSKDNSGPTIIRFEKIKGTDMQTEFGIVVVPEFGPLVFFILTGTMIMTLLFSKKLSYLNFKK